MLISFLLATAYRKQIYSANTDTGPTSRFEKRSGNLKPNLGSTFRLREGINV
jgi:hypothetical protein